jgi:hypothetical protein
MKSFRVKDLMINVFPCETCTFPNGEATCPDDTRICKVGCTVISCKEACTYVCTHFCTVACTYACTHACTAACTYACTYQCTAACTYGCTQACTAACTYQCTGACTYQCTYACTGACTYHCTHACTYYCTYACTNAVSCVAGCTHISCVEGCTHLTYCEVGCTRITCRGGDTLYPQTQEEESPASLADLKKQLKQQLADVEKREQAAAESQRPHTVGQIDQLMKKLQEAMDDLKSQRVELEQKEKQVASKKPAK